MNFLIWNSAYGMVDVSVTLSLPPGVILSCSDLGQYSLHFSYHNLFIMCVYMNATLTHIATSIYVQTIMTYSSHFHTVD